MEQAAALGVRATLILLSSKVGVVSSDSCVCCYTGLRLFIAYSCLVWLCSLNWFCSQAGRNKHMKSLQGEELVRKSGTGIVCKSELPGTWGHCNTS